MSGVIGRIPHGGILLLAIQPGTLVENSVLRSFVTRATGIGIGAFSLKKCRNRLIVNHTRVEGGVLIPPLFDIGVVALADGKSSEMHLEMADAVVKGRLSKQGRNVLVWASAQAKVKARIERSTMSEVGQDGVVAVAALVSLAISNARNSSSMFRKPSAHLSDSSRSIQTDERSVRCTPATRRQYGR